MEVVASASFSSMRKDSVCIREVWADNLDEEFKLIEGILEHCPFLAMDTAFPGFVYKTKPPGAWGEMRSDPNYAALKANVDSLCVIQVGFTFCDKYGNLPEILCERYVKKCVWQFNFKEFDLRKSKHAYDSIQLLRRSGIDFRKNKEEGIDSRRFRDLLLSSGIVQNPDVQWITFQGAYDFGYLLKLVTSQELPSTQEAFFKHLRHYFPNFYDVKFMLRYCDHLYGGLETVARQLKVERIAGSSHQAGSDSLLTSTVFLKLEETISEWNGKKCISIHAGQLLGLGF